MSANSDAKITFIGAGNMASSLIGGLCATQYSANAITATDPNQESLARLATEFGIHTTSDNAAAVAAADVVLLAVKPQIMADVVTPLRAAVEHSQPLIISIAAGISTQNLSDWLGDTTAIVRTMPNTPALVQTGATGLYANSHVSQVQRAITERIFDAVGIARWFNQEDDMDKVVAVSGSGPAYFFLVMEAMQRAATKMGLSEADARELTLQTALGSAQLAREQQLDFAELRRRVTSPGGTTEAAINSMQNDQLEALFERAMQAARARSMELAD